MYIVAAVVYDWHKQKENTPEKSHRDDKFKREFFPLDLCKWRKTMIFDLSFITISTLQYHIEMSVYKHINIVHFCNIFIIVLIEYV